MRNLTINKIQSELECGVGYAFGAQGVSVECGVGYVFGAQGGV